MHDPGRELGLLELQRFLIEDRTSSRQAGSTHEIFDPQTNVKVGIVREEPGALGNWLRGWFMRTFLPRKLEVRETEDESLVFTVHRPAGLWQRRIEVYDADDHLIGYGEHRSLFGRASLWVYDRRGLPFVEVRSDAQGRGCCLVGPNGQEWARVSREGTGSGKAAFADRYLVSMSDVLAEQPLAKMLLLGAALAVGIVGPGK